MCYGTKLPQRLPDPICFVNTFVLMARGHVYTAAQKLAARVRTCERKFLPAWAKDEGDYSASKSQGNFADDHSKGRMLARHNVWAGLAAGRGLAAIDYDHDHGHCDTFKPQRDDCMLQTKTLSDPFGIQGDALE
jgi:hypothetical protein